MGEERMLSVVIPVHNRAGIVTRTLRSIASQKDIDKVSVILVDNNSTDNTRDVLSQWMQSAEAAHLDVRLLDEPKPGACAARNCGLAAVTTPWVMFFDSDDEMLPGLVSDVLATVASKLETDIIAWSIEMGYPDGSRDIKRVPSEGFLWNHLIHAVLATQRFAARSSLVRDAGGWDESVSCWNDYELGVRLLIRKPRIEVLPDKVYVLTHFTEESLTGRLVSENHAGREHSLDCCEASLAAAGFGTVWIDIRRMILAGEYRREGRRDLAEDLMSRTLKGKWLSRKLFLKAIYLKHRVYHRGTGRFAALFLSKKVSIAKKIVTL